MHTQADLHEKQFYCACVIGACLFSRRFCGFELCDVFGCHESCFLFFYPFSMLGLCTFSIYCSFLCVSKTALFCLFWCCGFLVLAKFPSAFSSFAFFLCLSSLSLFCAFVFFVSDFSQSVLLATPLREKNRRHRHRFVAELHCRHRSAVSYTHLTLPTNSRV